MSQSASREQLTLTVEKALETRLAGNDKFKTGDLKGALRDYHTVLLTLKGLDSSIQEAMGGPPRPTTDLNETEEQKAQRDLTARTKNAILLTHINMAAIHIKNENWKRALDCAKDAQKIDENNVKAKFREAQARLGLGEVVLGKRMLEDLNAKNPDAAFTNALAQLAIQEKARGAKSDSQFRGMFGKEKKSAVAAGKAPAV